MPASHRATTGRLACLEPLAHVVHLRIEGRRRCRPGSARRARARASRRSRRSCSLATQIRISAPCRASAAQAADIGAGGVIGSVHRRHDAEVGRPMVAPALRPRRARQRGARPLHGRRGRPPAECRSRQEAPASIRPSPARGEAVDVVLLHQKRAMIVADHLARDRPARGCGRPRSRSRACTGGGPRPSNGRRTAACRA